MRVAPEPRDCTRPPVADHAGRTGCRSVRCAPVAAGAADAIRIGPVRVHRQRRAADRAGDARRYLAAHRTAAAAALLAQRPAEPVAHAARPRAARTTGWAGRIADLLAAKLGHSSSRSISRWPATSLMQAAKSRGRTSWAPTGPTTFTAFGTSGATLSRAQLVSQRSPTRLRLDLRARLCRACSGALASSRARSTRRSPRHPRCTTVFPTAARSAAAQDGRQADLGRAIGSDATRQIFFVAAGGFDTHDDQFADQPELFSTSARRLTAFHDGDRRTRRRAPNVTTFTQSDFGRTLTSNGDGSDHAWGGVQLVLGGSVRGRAIYGSYPELRIGAPNDVGGGRFIPAVSIRPVRRDAGEVAWRGLATLPPSRPTWAISPRRISGSWSSAEGIRDACRRRVARLR